MFALLAMIVLHFSDWYSFDEFKDLRLRIKTHYDLLIQKESEFKSAVVGTYTEGFKTFRFQKGAHIFVLPQYLTQRPHAKEP